LIDAVSADGVVTTGSDGLEDIRSNGSVSGSGQSESHSSEVRVSRVRSRFNSGKTKSSSSVHDLSKSNISGSS
jgi:hypothetical protein